MCTAFGVHFFAPPCKLGEVENEYTSEKLVLSAIFVPKI